VKPLTPAEFDFLSEMAADGDEEDDDARCERLCPGLRADGFVFIERTDVEPVSETVVDVWSITDAGRRAIRAHLAYLGVQA
jgi:hypothetical protein